MLSEDKARHTQLSDALDSLSSEDAAPGWKADAAWLRVGARIKNRRIPLWSYTLAAAAMLFCVMLLRPAEIKVPSGVGSITASGGIHSLEKKAVVASPAVLAPKRIAVAINKVFKVAELIPKKSGARTPTPENAVAVIQPEKQLLPKDTTSLIAAQPQRTSPYYRPLTVIYTLSEIMADVPEREAPPKRYSGIFYSRPSADAPAGTAPRRRSGRGGEGDVPASSIIIN